MFFSSETEILSASLHSLSEKLQPYLSDMNFRAGFSEPFSDLFKSRTYYLQAVCALDTGMKYSHGGYIFHFSDYALYYMLEHCCGDFEPAQLIPEGLNELSKHGRGTSYLEILKCYLDNECNASRTAAAMYLHRSSLMPKLEKIKSYVDLSTPEKRLYMRLCLYLDTDIP